MDSEEDDPEALSDDDGSANARLPGSVPGGMPRYVERKSVLGLFLRRVCLESSRMLFDGLSELYDTMLLYNHKDMYTTLTRSVFGTHSTPQKLSQRQRDEPGQWVGGMCVVPVGSGAAASGVGGGGGVPVGYTNTLPPRQLELQMDRSVWEMQTTSAGSCSDQQDDHPLQAYERNERDILRLSSSTGGGSTNATMLKCLYLRHLNALEHREYGVALDTLHQYFDHALWHGPFPSHKGKCTMTHTTTVYTLEHMTG